MERLHSGARRISEAVERFERQVGAGNAADASDAEIDSLIADFEGLAGKIENFAARAVPAIPQAEERAPAGTETAAASREA